MEMRRGLGNLLLLLTAVVWGMAFVGQRTGMDRIGPITFIAARMFLSALVVGALAAVLARRERLEEARRENGEGAGRRNRLLRRAQVRRNTLLGGLGCGCFLAIAGTFQQMGMVYTTAGKAGFITAMYMLLVPILGFLLLKRRNTWLAWLGVGVGVAGLYLLCMKEGFHLTRGDALVSLCALFFSGHILWCDHFVQRGNPIQIAAIQFVVVTVLDGILALLLENPTWDQVASAALPILYCGLVSGGVGYTLQIVGQRYTDPTVASLLMSLESVFAAIAGAVFLGERMTGRELLGCVIMFAAIVLVQIPLPDRRGPRGA